MDTSTEETNNQRKNPFENLTREELIIKCKQFLTIAQKAKQTKDELTDENKHLKHLNEKNVSKLNTMQELLTALTEQKLEIVTKYDTTTTQRNQLETKLQTLETENVSYNRQIKRLSDENEQLITHLETLEMRTNELNRIGQQQREQLLSLEQQQLANNTNNKDEIDVLKQENQQIGELKNICLLKNNEIKMLNEKLNELSVELTETKRSKEFYNEKSKLYHSKLVKVYSDLKELKQSKNKLLLIIDDYSKYVDQWKSDIKHGSKQFEFELKIRDEKIEELEQKSKEDQSKELRNENEETRQYKERIESLNKQLTEFKNEKIKLEDELSKSNQNKERIVSLEETLKQLNEILDSVKQEHSKLRIELLQFQQIEVELKETKEQNEELVEELLKISNEKGNLQEELTNEEKQNEESNVLLEEELKKLREELDGKNVEVMKISEENVSLQEELLVLKQNEETFNQLNESRRKEAEEKIVLLEHKLEELNEEKLKLQQKIEEDKNEANDKIEDMKLLQEKENVIQILINEKQQLTAANFKVESELKQQIESFQNENSNLQHQLMLSKNENVELLKEMNEMNQVLKERGESICKQQTQVEELLKKLEITEQELKEKMLRKQEEDKGVIEELTMELNERMNKIRSLEQELQQLKDSYTNNHESQDIDTESMSTSTVSRLEELSRMRDLEGSWEERYSKLRTLALKLKCKVKELNEKLEQEIANKSETQNLMTTLTRNIQTVQTEYDKLQDQFEKIAEENRTGMKQIETLTNENENLKRNFLNSTEQINKFQKKKFDSNNAAKEFLNQIQNLKKDLDNNNVLQKELKIKVQQIESDLKLKEEELKKEIKTHNVTKEQLQKYEKEVKKKSVLSLEMDDYERSVKDLSQKLEKRNEIITKLETRISSQDEMLISMKEQVSVLEERIKSEENQNKELEGEISNFKSKLNESEEIMNQKENTIRELNINLETFQGKNEILNMDLANFVTKHQKESDLLKQDKEYLKSQILGLEEKVKQLTKQLKDSDLELCSIRNEFSGYKVRAQSVLKQNKTRDVTVEERLNDELTELRSRLEEFRIQSVQNESALKELTIELDETNRNRTNLISKCEDLEHKLLKERTLNKELNTKQQQLVTEHVEAFRSQKIHTETLVQCYKQQLSEVEERHLKELNELRSVQTKQEENLDLSVMQREECEGSESVDSNSNFNTNPKQPLPLDKLLTMDPDSFETPNYELELSNCKKMLGEYETRVSYLTDLLADTEQDLAKHTQLNDLLKEEIRRQQRSIEREQHAENLEYLKNVVFKFLTLNNGDEKTHLIPVLNTILKLSPEETQKLNSVAKGPELSVRRWGSYLPIWNNSDNNN